MFTVVGKLRIYLVRDDIEIIVPYDLSHSLQILFSHDSACRIVGIRKYEYLGARRQLFLYLGSRKPEIIIAVKLYDNGNSSCENSTGLVRYI